LPIRRPRLKCGTVGLHAVGLVAVWWAAVVLKGPTICTRRSSCFHLAEGTGFQYLCFFFILQLCVLDNSTASPQQSLNCSNGLLCTNNVSKPLFSRKYRTRNLCVSQSGLYRKHLTNCVQEHRYIVWFISLFHQTC